MPAFFILRPCGIFWLELSGRFRARWSAQIHDEWKRILINALDQDAVLPLPLGNVRKLPT